MKKIISLLFSVLLVFSLFSCEKEQRESTEEKATAGLPEASAESCETEEDPMILPPEVPVEYAEVLKQYREIVRVFDADEVDIIYGEGIYELTPSGVDFVGWPSGFLEWRVTRDRFGYFVKDINGDEIPELFWVHDNHEILLAFTLSDGKPVGLFYSRPRDYVYVCDSGELVNFGSGGADHGIIRVMSLPPRSDHVVVEKYIGYGGEHDKETGEFVPSYETLSWEGELPYLDILDRYETLEKNPITKEEFDAFREGYQQLSFPTESWKQNKIHFIN